MPMKVLYPATESTERTETAPVARLVKTRVPVAFKTEMPCSLCVSRLELVAAYSFATPVVVKRPEKTTEYVVDANSKQNEN